MTDEEYMKYALEIAKKGMGRVSPNPMVGAVIVKDNKIIGEGYHAKYGEYHAERNAILECKADMTGASIYVTLEPCCHYGKTPPCTDIIIESGIKKVIVGCVDDNPKVGGKGIEILKKNGIEVITGVLEKECRELNYVFFHYIKNNMPIVVMKYAMTADGKIATVSGKSRWITGNMARENVHRLRNQLSAIMVGIGTVIKDDPELTCRIENGRNPIRIICDSKLRIGLESKIVKTGEEVRTIIATTENEDSKKARELKALGIEIIKTNGKDGKIDLKDLMKRLGEMKIDSILLEGGGELNFSALESGIVNRLQVYIAPKIFGGKEAKAPIGGKGIAEVENCVKLKMIRQEIIDEDILIEYEVKKCSQE